MCVCVCSEPLSNCTSALIGNEVLATDDPCFTCHCQVTLARLHRCTSQTAINTLCTLLMLRLSVSQDLTWTCLHRTCPSLSCPATEQFTPPDSCCPVCKGESGPCFLTFACSLGLSMLKSHVHYLFVFYAVCVIEGQTRVANGSNWTDSDDDCVTCACNVSQAQILGFVRVDLRKTSKIHYTDICGVIIKKIFFQLFNCLFEFNMCCDFCDWFPKVNSIKIVAVQ